MRSLRHPWLLACLICSSLTLLGLFYTTNIQAQQQPPTPPPFDPAAVPPPAQPPIANLGQAIYAQNCAPCHGEQGNSDGPTVSGLPAPPPRFSDPATIWTHSPAEYYHITKFGRIQKLMPPWGNRLNDTQIWQALYYAWSLHTNQKQVQSGAQLYAQSCASCHGTDGKGTGPAAKGKILDFTDSAQMIVRTQAELDTNWKTAHADLGKNWSEEQRRTVLDYIRTFSYLPPWESAYRPGNGVLHGQVRQGTPGGGVVATLPVTVTAYANFEPAKTITATTNISGQFTFTNLSTAEGIVYIAETTYANIRYNSTIYALTPTTPTQTVDLPVYETTTDDKGIHIGRANWLIDQEPGVLVVGQVINFSNQLDRTFIGKPVNGLSGPATVAMQVPDKATDIQFQDGVLGGRYQQVGNQVYDLTPLTPGEEVRQIVIQYRVPFNSDSAKVDQTWLYPIGQLNLLIPDLPNLQADVTALKANGTQTVQGTAYRYWSGSNLPASSIQVSLRGLIPSGGTDPRAAAGSSGVVAPLAAVPPLQKEVPLAVGAVILVTLTAVLVLPLRKQKGMDRTAALQQEKTTLIQHIAELDDQHASGALATATWSQERARLKSALLEVAQELESRSKGRGAGSEGQG